MTSNLQAIGLITIIIGACFGGLFWALRVLLSKGIEDMKKTIQREIQNINDHCKLVSGNLHTNIISETKQRVRADERLEDNFKNHGHRGLDNGGSKVTI